MSRSLVMVSEITSVFSQPEKNEGGNMPASGLLPCVYLVYHEVSYYSLYNTWVAGYKCGRMVFDPKGNSFKFQKGNFKMYCQKV